MQKLLILTLILLVSACGNQTIRPDRTEYIGLESAQRAYSQADYELAARLYAELFHQYNKPQFAVWVAESHIRNQNFAQASEWSGKIAPSEDTLHLLVLTELALNLNDGNKASYFFNQIQPPPPNQWRERFLLNKGKIAQNNGDFLTAAMALIDLGELQGGNYATEIISLLSRLPENYLSQQLFSSEWSFIQKGWLEAAYVDRSQDSAAINDWKQRWSNHPAMEYFLTTTSFQKIAVLLPLTGRYKTISNAIQQGMIAALDAVEDADTELQFFDTGSAGESFAGAWYSATESGAEFVIGPLEKNSVEQLKSMNSVTMPTLILNHLESEQNNLGVYQFPLLAQDEAKSIAKRLIGEGKRRVLLLAPDTDSGKELAAIFQNEYSFGAGRVMNQAFYQPVGNDFSNELKSLLGLLESQARIRRLQSILGTELKAEPQIRPDIDAIVLFANAKLARLMKPQLKFFKAENVPVYSTSQIFTGKVNPQKDKDLNGIRFSQSRFVTDSSAFDDMLGFEAGLLDLNKKFFAFGYDAVLLSSKLDWMFRQSGRELLGLSGQLSMDSQGMIHRDVSWAQFSQGEPRYLADLVLPDELENTDAESEESERLETLEDRSF